MLKVLNENMKQMLKIMSDGSLLVALDFSKKSTQDVLDEIEFRKTRKRIVVK